MDTPLARQRRQLGLTQKQLADQCGLWPNTIAQYERGERFPPRAHLPCLHRATGLTYKQLLFPAEYLAAHPDFLIEHAAPKPTPEVPAS